MDKRQSNPQVDTTVAQIGHERLQTAISINIASGEGVASSSIEPYIGLRSVPALVQHLTQERCNGDRWAYAIIDWDDYGPVKAGITL